MSDFELSKRARKLQEEVNQRLTKLKSKGVKNPLKKLPGYGSQWFCRKRKDPFIFQDSNEDLNPPPALELDPNKITQFIKHLNPAVSPPDKEDSEEVIQGPGFEFPTEKEVQKCNKHWSKRFKHWQPETKLTNQPSSKPFSIRFKAPLPSNEVEVEGRRFRLVERKEEIEELVKTTHCISKQQSTIFDPKFYADIVAEFGNAHFIRIATQSKEPELSLTDPEAQVIAVYAPLPLASKILTAMKKKLHAEGKGELADGLHVELKKLEAQEEEEEEDDDEVQYPPSAIKKSVSSTRHSTPLEEGDEASVFM